MSCSRIGRGESGGGAQVFWKPHGSPPSRSDCPRARGLCLHCLQALAQYILTWQEPRPVSDHAGRHYVGTTNHCKAVSGRHGLDEPWTAHIVHDCACLFLVRGVFAHRNSKLRESSARIQDKTVHEIVHIMDFAMSGSPPGPSPNKCKARPSSF